MKQTLLCAVLLRAVIAAENRHDTDPLASDVISPKVNVQIEADANTAVVIPGASSSSIADGCVIRDGIFGSRAPDFEVLEFNYELELTGAGNVEGAIAALELAMAGEVLEAVFPEGCQRRVLRSRRLAAVGLSINPPDQVVIDAPCSSTVPEENLCVVVDGAKTIFFEDQFPDGNDIVETLTERANTDMIFNSNVHNDIVRVTFIPLRPRGRSPPVVAEAQGDDPIDSNGGLGTPVIAAIAVGALLVVGVSVYYARRRLRSHVEFVA